MRKEIIFGLIGVGVGSVVGFFVGKKALEKKLDADYKEKLDSEVAQLHKEDYVLQSEADAMVEEAKKQAYEDGRNDQHKIDYEVLLKDKKYYVDDEDDPNVLREVNPSKELSPEEDENNPDNNFYQPDGSTITVTNATDEDLHKSSRPPKVLGEDPYDPEDPDTSYDQQEVYYFMQSNTLVDDDDHIRDEVETIGRKPRQFGFLQGNGKADDMWIRNYAQEMDYHLIRKNAAVSDEYDFEERDSREADNDEEELNE